MCSATEGASPVNRCTVAASATFSSTVRGVPGVPNTLNRVPELPNAHDGTSIAWPSSCGAICLNVFISRLVRSSWVGGSSGVRELVLEVEDLGEDQEARVGGPPSSSSKNSAISACHRVLTSVAAIPASAAQVVGVSTYPTSRPSSRRNSE